MQSTSPHRLSRFLTVPLLGLLVSLAAPRSSEAADTTVTFDNNSSVNVTVYSWRPGSNQWVSTGTTISPNRNPVTIDADWNSRWALRASSGNQKEMTVNLLARRLTVTDNDLGVGNSPPPPVGGSSIYAENNTNKTLELHAWKTGDVNTTKKGTFYPGDNQTYSAINGSKWKFRTTSGTWIGSTRQIGFGANRLVVSDGNNNPPPLPDPTTRKVNVDFVNRTGRTIEVYLLNGSRYQWMTDVAPNRPQTVQAEPGAAFQIRWDDTGETFATYAARNYNTTCTVNPPPGPQPSTDDDDDDDDDGNVIKNIFRKLKGD